MIILFTYSPHKEQEKKIFNNYKKILMFVLTIHFAKKKKLIMINLTIC